jgi:sporulation protein YlmC with PRC-barrel domain
MVEAETGRGAVLRTRDFLEWEVIDRAGEKIGSVGDVLIDRRGRVRFLDVEFGLPRKHVLLPEHRLEWGDKRFIVDGWTRDEVRALPPYDPAQAPDEAMLEDLERAYPWVYAEQAEEWLAPPGETRVVPLSEAKDFKLGSGAPEIRGWNVFGADGERVGTVSQLLVDPAALKVRYIDVDLLDDLFPLRDDRHVLVPLEQVDLKERGNDAWVRHLPAKQIGRFPAYTGGAVHPAMEAAVQRAFE